MERFDFPSDVKVVKRSSPWASILVGLAVILFLIVAIMASYLTYRAYRADYASSLPSRYKNEIIATTVLAWISFVVALVTLGMMFSKKKMFVGSMIGIIIAAVFSIITGSVVAAAANEVRGLEISREAYRISVTSAVLSFIGLVVLVLASIFILLNLRRKAKNTESSSSGLLNLGDVPAI